MSKKNSRRNAAFDEILELRGNRRADIIKIAFAVMVIILVITGEPFLVAMGVIPDGNMVVSAVMFMSAIVLAAFTGFASTDYAKKGHRIDELCDANAITKEEIKERERKRS